MQLTTGVYGNREIPITKGPFGFFLGQPRANRVVARGHWFNGNGQLLGYGDLAPQDLAQVAQEIAEDEVFVVVDQHSRGMRAGNIEAREIVCSALFIVTRGAIFMLWGGAMDLPDTFVQQGVTIQMVKRDEAFELVRRGMSLDD